MLKVLGRLHPLEIFWTQVCLPACLTKEYAAIRRWTTSDIATQPA